MQIIECEVVLEAQTPAIRTVAKIEKPKKTKKQAIEPEKVKEAEIQLAQNQAEIEKIIDLPEEELDKEIENLPVKA